MFPLGLFPRSTFQRIETLVLGIDNVCRRIGRKVLGLSLCDRVVCRARKVPTEQGELKAQSLQSRLALTFVTFRSGMASAVEQGIAVVTDQVKSQKNRDEEK